jgi:hypothetical protein
VTEKTLERIEEEWAHTINIDVIDESDEQPISEFDLKKILFAKGRERYLFSKGGDIDKEIDDLMNLPTDEYFWKEFDGHEIRSIKYEGVVYVNGKDKTIKVLGKTIKPSLKDIKELMDEAFYEEFGYRNVNDYMKSSGEFEKGGSVYISNKRAREISDAWHGGQWSALYQFASSGTYVVENHLKYLKEIQENLEPEYGLHPTTLSKKDEAALNSLKRWFEYKGKENGIKTEWEKHKLYGYKIPYVSEDTPDAIAGKVEPLKFMV